VGFYIRKGVSAGPLRFNLSRSGLGVSVGVKGFRIGSGPRGNYVHMGRGGLYYRASLGRPRHRVAPASQWSPPFSPAPDPSLAQGMVEVETGNILDMVPSQGEAIVREINEKLNRLWLWPWVLAAGLTGTAVLAAKPAGQPFAIALIVIAAALTALVALLDTQRKSIVVLYDLDEEIASAFKAFADEFDRAALASSIWNIDSAGRTFDWKRNAGAGRLISRKPARFGYGLPGIVKTNLETPSITGGRQNIYFLPDVALVTEGKTAGAVPYDDLNIYWNTTVFIEDERVPSDAQIVGYTWRFVNRDGGPDRRFNNNRQIPQVLYQQMGLQGANGFQKILHISRVTERREFDQALAGLRMMVSRMRREMPLADAQSGVSAPSPSLLLPSPEAKPPATSQDAADAPQHTWVRAPLFLVVLAILGTAFVVVLGLGLYWQFPVPRAVGSAVVATIPPARMSTAPVTAGTPAPQNSEAVAPVSSVRPSFDCAAARQPLEVTICADPALSLTDMRYVQAYQALRQVTTEDGRWPLQQEAVDFQREVLSRCSVPANGLAPPLTETLRSCIAAAYNGQRADWIRRLPPVAVAEVSRPIKQHIALQHDLADLGFLPPGAAIDGVYGPVTRSAILTWQQAQGRVPTAFLSDDEARLVTAEATSGRSATMASSQPGPPPSDAFSRGMADWRELKAWSDAQTGEVADGVRYWEANRNVAGHASCVEKAARWAQTAGDASAFLYGCEQVKQRLDPIDAHRQSDADYRAGFSGGAKVAPLSPAGSLVPGMRP
jgi:hypothetical protein